MNIINALKDANIFSHEDISVFENYSPDKKYRICWSLEFYNVTILMLLIDLQYKYKSSSHIINNIIKEYTKKVPEDIYKLNEIDDNAICICIRESYIETIKILLENGANINYQYGNEENTVINFATRQNCLNISKLLIEYDADYNTKDKYGDNVLNYHHYSWDDRIINNVTILNAKN